MKMKMKNHKGSMIARIIIMGLMALAMCWFPSGANADMTGHFIVKGAVVGNWIIGVRIRDGTVFYDQANPPPGATCNTSWNYTLPGGGRTWDFYCPYICL